MHLWGEWHIMDTFKIVHKDTHSTQTTHTNHTQMQKHTYKHMLHTLDTWTYTQTTQHANIHTTTHHTNTHITHTCHNLTTHTHTTLSHPYHTHTYTRHTLTYTTHTYACTLRCTFMYQCYCHWKTTYHIISLFPQVSSFHSCVQDMPWGLST